MAADPTEVTTPRRGHALPGAPLAAVSALVLGALGCVVLSVVSGSVPGHARASGVWSLVHALLAVAVSGGVVLVLRWRLRAVVAEREVWRWFAVAACVVAVGTAADLVLAVLDRAGLSGGPVPGRSAALAVTGLAWLFVYQGLIWWNRFQTQVADPGDWLNGVGAVLALTAIGHLVVDRLDVGIGAWPEWELQTWLLRVSAALTLMGTAAVVASSGLARDPRLWAVTGSVGLVTVGEVAVALGGPWLPIPVSGPLTNWVVAGATLAVCAVLRPGVARPRPASAQTPTVGALVVLLASVAVLVATGVGGTGAHVPVVYAAFAALLVAARIGHVVRDLASLAQTRREAMTDELTGVPNRRALMAALDDATRGDEPVALLVVDLDRFKDVNDRYGHTVGDELLNRVASRFGAEVPSSGMLTRLGGDEFAVLLRADVRAAGSLARALVQAASHAVDVGGRRLRVGASVGVATAPGDGGEEGHRDAVGAGELLRRADAAMYLAKSAGGGVSVYDRAVDDAAQEARRRLEELRVALDDRAATGGGGRLVVAYQPQVDLATGEPVGAEALVRWEHPRLGLLGPDGFLDLAEEHGLMPALTAVVLREAVVQAADWHAAGFCLRMAVNLSPSCLPHERLLPVVDDLLARTGLPPSALVLEITESTFMHDPGQSLVATRALRARGIGVSIDDYGTGYASLAYLSDLPATELKLDRSFTARVASDPRTVAIVGGTAELAHRLGLRLVAEGVEDERTLQVLRALGCDETQGYLHSRPLPAAELTTWLRARAPGAAVPAARRAPALEVAPRAVLQTG